MGGCLTQIQPVTQSDNTIKNERRYLAFASTPFNVNQRHYSTTEKELASLRHFVYVFRSLLIGTKFRIMTDHSALIYMLSNKHYNPRIIRTLEDLASYDFTIHFVPGRTNSAADYLSRIHNFNNNISIPKNIEHGYPINYFTMEEIPGGGNSIFDSLFWLMARKKHPKIENLTCLELREILIKELITNKNKYFQKSNKKEENSKLSRELQNMMYSNYLPCWEVLIEASKYFVTDIYVFFSEITILIFSYKTNILLEKEGYEDKLFLYCRSCSHCNPLILKPNKSGKTTEDLIQEITHKPEMQISDFSYGTMRHNDNKVEIMKEKQLAVNENFNIFNEVLLRCTKHTTNTGYCMTSEFNEYVAQGFICVFIDSGFNRSAISLDLYKELLVNPMIKDGLDLKPYPNNLVSFGNYSVEVIGIINCPVNIIFTDFESPLFSNKNAQFLVIQSINDQHCMIIGMNLLHGFQCILNGENNTLEFPLSGKHLKLMTPFKEEYLQSSITLGSQNILIELEELAVASSRSSVEIDYIHLNSAAIQSSHWKNEPSILSISLFEIFRIQRGDKALRNLFKFVIQLDTEYRKIDFTNLPSNCYHFKNFVKHIHLKDKVMYFKSKVILPKHFIIGLALDLHCHLAHIGYEKLLTLLASEIFYPKLKDLILEITTTCLDCQILKDHPLRYPPPILKIKTSYPGEIIAVDLISLPRTYKGYVGCLVAVDLNSKRALAIPIKNKTGATISYVFENNILNSLVPNISKVLSDNGGEFISSEFSMVLNKYNIEHIKITPLNPGSNGTVERFNRSLLNILRSLKVHGTSWDLNLAQTIQLYNDTFHKEIKCSPNHYILTKKHKISKTIRAPKAVIQTWREGHKDFQPFKINQLVLFKVNFQGNLNINKLKQRYIGPFKIVAIDSNNLSYNIERIIDGRVENRRAHYKSLRYWRLPGKSLRCHPKYLSIYGETLKLMNSQVQPSNSIEENKLPSLGEELRLNTELETNADKSERNKFNNDIPFGFGYFSLEHLSSLDLTESMKPLIPLTEKVPTAITKVTQLPETVVEFGRKINLPVSMEDSIDESNVAKKYHK